MPFSLRVGLVCLVEVSIEETNFRFVLKLDGRQCGVVVIEYPIVLIEVDDQIGRLVAVRLLYSFIVSNVTFL